ncbi:hypothetical protein [Dictyobacter kobayashii]|uniref:Uncharacterized protein n=1 Tax=Dictyobacter kobayashii TaxID=2014872 RepID=A0A402AHF4_9CHLR|nr:hypothetical protein [Dictyobacter kobayashii]GCE18562.1 hypothetical protein KDK_23620 [Dictyobacter kobayashii]
MNEEDNWLHGEQVECPACHQLLYRVAHAPFYDEHFLYCERCPIHVEVSYYDSVYKQLYKQVRQEHALSQTGGVKALMRTIEEHLKPCSCGGSFRHDAPRRCFTCHTAVVVDDASDVDLWRWSAAFLADDSKVADDVLEDEERWHSQFIAGEDKWK